MTMSTINLIIIISKGDLTKVYFREEMEIKKRLKFKEIHKSKRKQILFKVKWIHTLQSLNPEPFSSKHVIGIWGFEW